MTQQVTNLYIYNQQGVLVMSGEIDVNTSYKEFYLANIRPGIYFISVNDSFNKKNQSIIVK